jgi:hypothetical protein
MIICSSPGQHTYGTSCTLAAAPGRVRDPRGSDQLSTYTGGSRMNVLSSRSYGPIVRGLNFDSLRNCQAQCQLLVNCRNDMDARKMRCKLLQRMQVLLWAILSAQCSRNINILQLCSCLAWLYYHLSISKTRARHGARLGQLVNKTW